MKKGLNILDFPKHLFWDLNMEKFDIEKNSTIIIERVFNRGDIQDLHIIIRYFGMEIIKAEIIKAGFLDKKTINFASKILNIPKSEFQCYSKIQSKQVHWNF